MFGLEGLFLGGEARCSRWKKKEKKKSLSLIKNTKCR